MNGMDMAAVPLTSSTAMGMKRISVIVMFMEDGITVVVLAQFKALPDSMYLGNKISLNLPSKSVIVIIYSY